MFFFPRAFRISTCQKIAFVSSERCRKILSHDEISALRTDAPGYNLTASWLTVTKRSGHWTFFPRVSALARKMRTQDERQKIEDSRDEALNTS